MFFRVVYHPHHPHASVYFPCSLNSCFHVTHANFFSSCSLSPLIHFREIVDLPDGGQVSLDWYDGPPRPKDQYTDENRPIALFMPGLTGDSQTEYIKSLIPNAHALGYRSVSI